MIADLGHGVIDQMLARGLKADRYQYRDRRSNEVASFDMSLIADSTRYPFRLQLEQYEFTRMVNAALCSCRRRTFVSPTRSPALPRPAITSMSRWRPRRHRDCSRRLPGSAEGARSQIRKLAGIDYLGFTYDEKFLVVSTDFPFETVFDDLSG